MILIVLGILIFWTDQRCMSTVDWESSAILLSSNTSYRLSIGMRGRCDNGLDY
jgi:hypothetical protein